jgi:SAM-dependent methyltransferase
VTANQVDGPSAPDTHRESQAATFDTNVAHIARVYDYWLGGKDNYAADREAAEQAMAIIPSLPQGTRANRAFLGRTVRYLAEEAGIRQFLDIGTGIPTANNTHEVAQKVAPESRIVYVDNDPVVLAHARALLASSPQGACDYIDSDLRNVGTILPEAARTIDFGRPVAVMLVAILHCIPDEDDPHAIVARLLDAVAPGSYLVISHPARDIEADTVQKFATGLNNLLAEKITPRTHDEVSSFFSGLDLVEPGVVPVPEWRPDSEAAAAAKAHVWGAVGHKP